MNPTPSPTKRRRARELDQLLVHSASNAPSTRRRSSYRGSNGFVDTATKVEQSDSNQSSPDKPDSDNEVCKRIDFAPSAAVEETNISFSVEILIRYSEWICNAILSPIIRSIQSFFATTLKSPLENAANYLGKVSYSSIVTEVSDLASHQLSSVNSLISKKAVDLFAFFEEQKKTFSFQEFRSFLNARKLKLIFWALLIFAFFNMAWVRDTSVVLFQSKVIENDFEPRHHEHNATGRKRSRFFFSRRESSQVNTTQQQTDRISQNYLNDLVKREAYLPRPDFSIAFHRQVSTFLRILQDILTFNFLGNGTAEVQTKIEVDVKQNWTIGKAVNKSWSKAVFIFRNIKNNIHKRIQS